ncbi:DUF4252 domain-containing protein [Aequorivita sp. SDUM287046]|uniref:DUF4252 domain-containing protein n=1 Tax=Aequorivita aurantiaca TaxID=3053356 RepID=A0ABT8DL17_9FLAO|nr:DUF4252 domain-containing protein [Aequorivita aurantiaca]MDN3723742.1 DUF4252 domain-containing protein [Aequorivita aurantiaca]
MATLKYISALVFGLTALVSCNDKSLQKYLVEKQDDDKFVKMDIAASLLQGKNNNFTQEEQEILNTIKKVNVVAYPIIEGDTADYEKERLELKAILDQEQYKELTRIKSNDWNATLKYTGEEDAINEVIVFASDDNRGFAVFRLLGENMRPDQMMQLMKSAERGDLDVSKLEGFGEIFKD